jgi:26 proteasome complex subunit DSS1
LLITFLCYELLNHDQLLYKSKQPASSENTARAPQLVSIEPSEQSPKTFAVMSGAAQGSAATAKLEEDKKAGGEPQKEQQPQQPALLEEDDEFEDFPVEGVSPLQRLAVRAPTNQHASDWTEEESKVPGGNAHLWEESWDDDDQNEDFSKQLRYGFPSVLLLRGGQQLIKTRREELKKVEAAKSS